MKEIPRNIPTGTGTFGLHSGQKGGKRPLSAAAGRQMEKPAGQWEWPAGRRDRRSNRSKPVAPGGDGSVSAERNSREADGKERPAQQPAEAAATGGATSRNRWPREAAGRRRRGGAPERPTGRSGRRGNQWDGGSASAGRNSREADGKERPAEQPVGRRVGVGGEELPRGRREGAAGAATGRGGDRRGNQWDGGSASAGRNSREAGGKKRPEGATSRDRWPREAAATGGATSGTAGRRAPAKKTPRSGTPGCRRTSRLQHNTLILKY